MLPIKLAHAVNVFAGKPGSDAQRIQQITLESLQRARQQGGDEIEVDLLSVQFGEDREFVPAFMHMTADLERSIQDDVECEDKRKLPYIYDILEKAYESSDADFLIYSNMDISVYPTFYRFVANAIHQGIDALAINRAQIPRYSRDCDLLHKLSLDDWLSIRKRTPHRGIDCVMFRRETLSKWRKNKICIGYPPIGKYLLENAEAHANRFFWFRDVYQTFHIGIDSEETSPWKKLQGNSIWVRNSQEFDNVRIISEDAWKRHGFTRQKWIAQRTKWLIRSFLRW